LLTVSYFTSLPGKEDCIIRSFHLFLLLIEADVYKFSISRLPLE
jgi:hypothetical protein